MNKRIEAVFELDSFQRMVESADASGKSAAFKDLHYSANFIKGSSIIQQSLQAKTKVPLSPEPTEEKGIMKPSEEELPRFGSVTKDPGEEEAEKINALVTDLLKDDGGDQFKGRSLQNDDSLSNIAPAVAAEKDPAAVTKSPQISSQTHDLDKALREIVDEEGLQPGKQMYEGAALQKMNPEAVDEYVDEDDPGFDTYVVNEENFVASCQELAKLNDFPKRAIAADTKHDMAHRERHRKAIEAKRKT